MIEVIIKCTSKGFELNLITLIFGLPSTGDIIEVDDKEYEVKFKTFRADHPAVIINVEIQ